ncbi:MAG: respiratory chain complex I subunit 1 family protein [Elusimicrobiaceae bacterium]
MKTTEIIISITQVSLIVFFAPLLNGFIKKTKAAFQNRRGPDLIQPYRDLLKFFRKEETVSETSSWLFRAVPVITLGATVTVCFMIPVFTALTPFGFMGDIIVIVYLLALPRFFMALGGLDAGSAFGGMGSSREMMISSLAEPTFILSLFAMAVQTGTTHTGEIVSRLSQQQWILLGPGMAMAFAALFMVMLAECARLPVDNPTTHLELTMIHEAMILEHSGRSLAMLEWASMIKMTFFLTLLANLFMPLYLPGETGLAELGLGAGVYVFKILSLAVLICAVETSTAKLRLFRVPDFLGTAFALSLLGLLSEGIFRMVS